MANNELDFATLAALVKALGGSADPAVIEAAVDAWLDAHPEATTTVQDGSITNAKLDASLQETVADVGDLKTAMNAVENAVDDLEAGSLSALGASSGQVPVADGEGSWAWGSGGGDVSDVQINGTSILSSGVANIPASGVSTLGVIQIARDTDVKAGTNFEKALVPLRQSASTFYGLAKAAGDTTQKDSANSVGTYTESAKSAISQMLSGSVAITGTTPAITALPGIRYVCGEVATLAITLPASGIVDVIFESGSTPTVLTVTPPSGVTAFKWANGFDPTSLDANTTYEINVMDGEFGVVGAWT